jgi:type II secretory pathway component PulF
MTLPVTEGSEGYSYYQRYACARYDTDIRRTLRILRRACSFGWPVAILMIEALSVIKRRLAQAGPRLRWDRLTLSPPLVGPVILAVQTARFARITGTLLKAGVALPVA